MVGGHEYYVSGKFTFQNAFQVIKGGHVFYKPSSKLHPASVTLRIWDIDPDKVPQTKINKDDFFSFLMKRSPTVDEDDLEDIEDFKKN